MRFVECPIYISHSANIVFAEFLEALGKAPSGIFAPARLLLHHYISVRLPLCDLPYITAVPSLPPIVIVPIPLATITTSSSSIAPFSFSPPPLPPNHVSLHHAPYRHNTWCFHTHKRPSSWARDFATSHLHHHTLTSTIAREDGDKCGTVGVAGGILGGNTVKLAKMKEIWSWFPNVEEMVKESMSVAMCTTLAGQLVRQMIPDNWTISMETLL